MRAICMERFGGPDVLVERDVPRPKPGPGEVLVKVHATSVNHIDTVLRRTPGYGVQPPAILGADVSGEVASVGDGVRHLRVEDEVYYTPEVGLGRAGTYAEYHVVPAEIVARKPRTVSHAKAAAIPLAGSTAWQALVDRAAIRAGETVLVHGGGGGVGSFAVQIARAAGCRVLATCGRYNFFLVRQIGAARAIDYRKEDFVDVVRQETDGGADVILDTQGGAVFQRSLEALAPGGRIVTTRSDGPIDLGAAQARNVTVHCLRTQRSRETLESLCRLVERGQIEPIAGDVRHLNDAPNAHRDIEQGCGRHGKIVLRVQ